MILPRLNQLSTGALVTPEPQPCIRSVRLVDKGPWCPAIISWTRLLHEPGEPENVMDDRSPELVGLVSGRYVEPERIWLVGGANVQALAERDYQRQIDEVRQADIGNYYDPRLHPWRAVKLEAIEIPFADRAASPSRSGVDRNADRIAGEPHAAIRSPIRRRARPAPG